MSKHLLRELLGLNKSSMGTNTNTNTDNKTNAQIYSTDKGRDVTLPSSSLPLSYPTDQNDDLSDISTPLLYKTLNANFKNKNELEFFSTDKDKMVRMPASNKVRIIKDLSELSTLNADRVSGQGTLTTLNVSGQGTNQIPSQEIDLSNSSILSDDFSNKLRIIKELSGSNSDTNSDIYSDIYSEIDLGKYDNSSILSNDNSSILSNDLSNKSSYNSNQDTSYDSFFDIIKSYKGSYKGSSKGSSTNSEYNKRISNSSIPSSTDSYNIFKSSHRK